MNAKVILLHIIADAGNYATPGHSPVMGYTGYIDVSPTVLASEEGLKNAAHTPF